MSWLFGAFLIAHGLVHVVIWLVPASDDVPFDVRRSWAFGDLGTGVTALAMAVGAAFVVAGIAVLASAAWWPPIVVGAAAGSLALLAVTFTPWWLLGIAIDVGLVVVALRDLWAG